MSSKMSIKANATSKATHCLERAMGDVLSKHDIQLTIEKYSTKTDTVPKEAVPEVREVLSKGDAKKQTTFVYENGAPNLSASLLPDFHMLTYPLGKERAQNGLVLKTQKGVFRMESIENELLGENVLEAGDELSEHASPPVGYVQGSRGEFFLIFQLRGKALSQNGKKADKTLTDYEKRKSASGMMERLARLHNQGFSCGGLGPGDAELTGGSVKVMKASRIVAMIDSDSLLYDVASTIYKFKAAGFATSKEMSAEYLSMSVVGRAAVSSHIKQKKLKGTPSEELAKAAERFGMYFPQLKEVA